MKKFYLLFLLLPLNLWSYCTGEIRAGYFNPSSSVVKDVYGGGIEYEAEIAYWPSDYVNFWLNFNSFCKKGDFLENHSSLRLFPISIGLKGICPISSCISLYLGIGPSFSAIITRNFPNLTDHTSKYLWGAVGKTGILYSFSQCFFLDLYADYYHTARHTSSYKLNLGGLRAGLGIGFIF